MSNKWTVTPESTTLNLEHPETKDPFWIKVKNHLTVGEARAVTTAGWRGMSSEAKSGKPGAAGKDEMQTEISIDWQKQTFARTRAYLVDWSLRADGVDPDRDGIESLRPEVYKVIEDAITAHVEAMEREKKVTAPEKLPNSMSA